MTWFADRVLNWFDAHGRKDLPWQHPRTPYRVWISEVMLQQTQVATVIPYFERFVTRFPDIDMLARADLDEVLHLWTGLGYYARGRNLHAAANIIVSQHNGTIPRDINELLALPGIGRSTAGAVLAAGFGIRAAILDGNVKRSLARYHGVDGYPGESSIAKQLWAHAETHTPARRIADYTQAVMDFGALVCTRTNPNCAQCPVAARCVARVSNRVASLPTPRPRRLLPVRRAAMFLITDAEQRCLLEKRPPTGVWGGLWGPPERAGDTDPATLLMELGLPAEACRCTESLPGFRHTFTHFHLDVEATHIHIDTTAPTIADGDRWCWHHPRANQPLGLSAVAVKLMALIHEPAAIA